MQNCVQSGMPLVAHCYISHAPITWPVRPGPPSPSPSPPSPSPSSMSITVYNIRSKNAPGGLSNKNAGDIAGDLNFIFAAPGASGAAARGCYRYHRGIITQAQVTVTLPWGGYQHCNHDARYRYHCDGWTSRAGTEKDAHTGGVWYSFPGAGVGKYWKQTAFKEVEASSLIASIGIAAHCDCSPASVSADSCHKCGRCVMAAYKLQRQAIESTWKAAFAGTAMVNSAFNHSELVV